MNNRIKPYNATTCIFLVFLVFQFAILVQAQSPWVSYLPTDAAFQVSFPSKPQVESFQSQMLGNKYPTDMYAASGADGDYACVVGRMKLPRIISLQMQSPTDSKQATIFLKSFVEGVANGIGLPVNEVQAQDQGTVSAGKEVGRQYRLNLAETPAVARLFVVKSTLYVLLVIGRSEESAEARNFLGSLKFPIEAVGVPGGKNGINDTFKPEYLSTSPPPPPPPPPVNTHQPKESLPETIIILPSEILENRALRKVSATYSNIAKAARASGEVKVAITVSKEGHVINAEAVSGHPLLKEASVQAAQQWTFKPARLDGESVKVRGILIFTFTLK